MNVVAIIQARIGSSRLYNKVLEDIVGKPMLEHLIDRVKKAGTLNSIVIATSDKDQDKAIANLAKKNNVNYFQGSEDDVLDRYIKASKQFNADIVVRICADNPLTDPNEIDKLIRHHIRTKADYSYNNLPHSNGLPDGAGAETITNEILYKIDKLATKKEHREHVTLFIRENPAMFKIERLNADPNLARPEFRLDVDYLEDLEFIREIYKKLYVPGEIIKLKDVINLLDAHPGLHKMRKER